MSLLQRLEAHRARAPRAAYGTSSPSTGPSMAVRQHFHAPALSIVAADLIAALASTHSLHGKKHPAFVSRLDCFPCDECSRPPRERVVGDVDAGVWRFMCLSKTGTQLAVPNNPGSSAAAVAGYCRPCGHHARYSLAGLSQPSKLETCAGERVSVLTATARIWAGSALGVQRERGAVSRSVAVRPSTSSEDLSQRRHQGWLRRFQWSLAEGAQCVDALTMLVGWLMTGA